jgi:hypothetical protein
LFRTKYFIFEYTIEKKDNVDIYKIKNFVNLPVWNIVGYGGIHPITLQSKRGTWYNIRPTSVKEWNIIKTPETFIECIIQSIHDCPNKIDNFDKENAVKEIRRQFEIIKFNYNI